MIGKVTRGNDLGGLLRYLYGPGKANEHTNPHLAASWRGDDRLNLDALEPAAGRGRQRFAHLADRLSLPLSLLPDVPDKHVWQCSMRLAGGDRHLSDAEWAQVAREVVSATGFATALDPGGCRWVAVRHADDHIHVVVVLARQDGQPVDTFRDWPKVHAAARAVEQRFGLTTVPSPDNSTTVAPVRGEVEKASRFGRKDSSRAWLTRQVRAAAAGSTSRPLFERLLQEHPELLVTWRYSQKNPGQVTGYRVGRQGDVDAHAQQVWFSGSKLSPDLSLPKLQARWHEVEGSATRTSRNVPREAVLDHAARSLARAVRDGAHPDTAVSASEVATSLARIVEGPEGGSLTKAAEEQARAARRPGGIRPQLTHHVHVLRHVASNLAQLGMLLPEEADNALLIVAHLMQLSAALHGRRAGHAGTAKSPLAVGHYAEYAGTVPLSQQQHVRLALGDAMGTQVVSDPAWPAVAAQLRRIHSAGDDPITALRQIAERRELTSAASIASVLHHRMKAATKSGPPASSPGIKPSPTRTRLRGPQPRNQPAPHLPRSPSL